MKKIWLKLGAKANSSSHIHWVWKMFLEANMQNPEKAGLIDQANTSSFKHRILIY